MSCLGELVLKEDAVTPKKQKKCEPCEVGAPFYMATFSDMAILLMAFFVLLLSMTKST